MINHANPYRLKVSIKMSYSKVKNWIGINKSRRVKLMITLLWSVCFTCNNTGEACKGTWATNYCLLLEGRCADLYRCLSAILHLLHCLLKTFTIRTCWSLAKHLKEYQTVGSSERNMWLLKITNKEEKQLRRLSIVCERIV